MSNDTTSMNETLSAKIRHSLRGGLARLLLTVCFQASAMQATAQETAVPEPQTPESAFELTLDAPKFASRGSVVQIERRGRWMTSWGAASLGVGAGLMVGVAASAASCARHTACDYLAGGGMLLTGSVLLITGAILTPLGVKRKRWAREHKERELEVSFSPTGVLLRGTF